ncbi:MAG: hypothetical protein IKD59_05415 [Lachnospiraceae bacterium]|nr:hypothetical protein [Lachnospiraceae bacterium]
MENITLGQIQSIMLFVIAFGGATVTIVTAIKKIIENALKPTNAKIDDLKENDHKNGDMIYQILDHLASNNNTGEMKRALNEYNEYFRHS